MWVQRFVLFNKSEVLRSLLSHRSKPRAGRLIGFGGSDLPSDAGCATAHRRRVLKKSQRGFKISGKYRDADPRCIRNTHALPTALCLKRQRVYFTAEKRLSKEADDMIGWEPATRPVLVDGAEGAPTLSEIDGFKPAPLA